MTHHQQTGLVPAGDRSPAPEPPVADMDTSPAYLTGLTQALLAQALVHLKELQRRDPLLARDLALRWTDILLTTL